MTLPSALIAAVARPVVVGEPAQAFPFLTVDAEALPHVALLSGNEVAVAEDGSLLVVLAGPTTRANLVRTERATLVVIDAASCHTVKVRVRQSIDAEGLLGAVLAVVSHKDDTLGLPLAPISFVPTLQLAELEHWDRSARVLERLRQLAGR